MRYIIIGMPGSGKSCLELPKTILSLLEVESEIFEIPFVMNKEEYSIKDSWLLGKDLKIEPFNEEKVKNSNDPIIFCDESMYISKNHIEFLNKNKFKKVILVSGLITHFKWLENINDYKIIETKELNKIGFSIVRVSFLMNKYYRDFKYILKNYKSK
ncbi:MAG: hypothetical protein JKY54_02800 [Flavobacteriales bacterium]|nr:hypothetical protein [Flavobacteriales bacterium]